jgi:hypothetical protein
MLKVLWCLLAAARSLLKKQRELALENRRFATRLVC